MLIELQALTIFAQRKKVMLQQDPESLAVLVPPMPPAHCIRRRNPKNKDMPSHWSLRLGLPKPASRCSSPKCFVFKGTRLQNQTLPPSLTTVAPSASARWFPGFHALQPA